MPSSGGQTCADRKSTRLNSSHTLISYAVFCLKKKKQNHIPPPLRTLVSERSTLPTVILSYACPCHTHALLRSPPFFALFCFFFFFFLKDPAPPEIYPLPLHDALPISARAASRHRRRRHPPPPPPRSRRSRGGGIGREHVCNPITLPPPFPLSVLI